MEKIYFHIFILEPYYGDGNTLLKLVAVVLHHEWQPFVLHLEETIMIYGIFLMFLKVMVT